MLLRSCVNIYIYVNICKNIYVCLARYLLFFFDADSNNISKHGLVEWVFFGGEYRIRAVISVKS